jgi:hypothetical protein
LFGWNWKARCSEKVLTRSDDIVPSSLAGLAV